MAPRGNAEEIFNKAVELSDPAEQGAYLDEACGEDEKLRAQVEALLRWHQEAGNLLEVPAVDPNVTLDTSASGEGPGAMTRGVTTLCGVVGTSPFSGSKSGSLDFIQSG